MKFVVHLEVWVDTDDSTSAYYKVGELLLGKDGQPAVEKWRINDIEMATD